HYHRQRGDPVGEIGEPAGDSGSPLMLHTDDGWPLIGVQSSAPAAKDRWRADNRAISATGFRDKLDQLSQK
ncbi:hypothetical protein AB2908_24590, partial [Escherichia coli]